MNVPWGRGQEGAVFENEQSRTRGERGLKIGNLEQKYFSNDPKHKKDKIVTLSFPKFVSFHHLSVQEELRISEIFQ